MKKLISFSLWGDNPMYNEGILTNVELAKEFYPDWICKIYFDRSVSKRTILKLSFKHNVELEFLDPAPIYGMFWRFFAFEEENVSHVIIRDADSRLDEREAVAVQRWIESNKDLHIIRDHPCHGLKVMGGMWGAKTERLKNMKNLILAWALKRNEDLKYFSDQTFLAEVVYPMFGNNRYVNDEFFNITEEKNECHSFEVGRINYKFVGERYDEKNERNQNDYLIIKNHLEQYNK